MDYRDTVFLAVAEKLSFSKAAEDLFISQPAVTKHIKELERTYSMDLFERKGNKIYLTKAGKLTYRHLKAIAQQYRELTFELGSLGDAFKGELRIGASSTISQYIIPAVIADFHKRYPKIELYVYNGNSFAMEQKLLDKEIDMALVENAASQANIQYADFAMDEIIVVTASKSVYAKRKTLRLADLQEIPIVLRERGSGTLELIQRELMKQGIAVEKLNITVHLGSTEAIKHFMSNFDGIALVSDKAVEKELRSNQLTKLAIKDFTINRQLRLAYRQGHRGEASQLFADYLLRYNL